MYFPPRRKLGKKNAVITNIGAAIDIYPIGLSILYKPLFGLQLAIGVVPLEFFIEREEFYVGATRDFGYSDP